MRYIEITESGDGSIHLPAGLSPANYEIGPLKDIDSWKAKIILANSATKEQNVGDWDDVGYILIDHKSNTVIPVARADEHNTGYDLLNHLNKRRIIKVDPNTFCSIFNGNNYVYDEEDVSEMTEVARWWLAHGGPDLTVKGTNELTGLYGLFSDFIKHGLSLLPQPNRLNVVGERFIAALRGMSELITKYEMAKRREANTSPLEKSIISRASMVSRQANSITKMLWDDSLDDAVTKLNAAIHSEDVAAIIELTFSFHGVKNIVHQSLRGAIADRSSPSRVDYILISIFGDLDMANGLLASL